MKFTITNPKAYTALAELIRQAQDGDEITVPTEEMVELGMRFRRQVYPNKALIFARPCKEVELFPGGKIHIHELTSLSKE